MSLCAVIRTMGWSFLQEETKCNNQFNFDKEAMHLIENIIWRNLFYNEKDNVTVAYKEKIFCYGSCYYDKYRYVIKIITYSNNCRIYFDNHVVPTITLKYPVDFNEQMFCLKWFQCSFQEIVHLKVVMRDTPILLL